MLKFLEFCEARERTPEQADRLGNYLVRRSSREMRIHGHGPDAVKNNRTYDLGNYSHMDDEHDDEHFSRAWTYAHSRFKKKNIEHLPIKDLLKNNKQGVAHDSHGFVHKLKDDRPINVARSRKTGELYVVDGYHRIASHWLRGKSHIKANVQDVGRSPKKPK